MALTASGSFKRWLETSLKAPATGTGAGATVDLDGHTFNCALYTSSFTGENFLTDVAYGTSPWTSGNGEHGATGTYATGGLAIGSGTKTFLATGTGSGGIAWWPGAFVSWGSSTLTARSALVYDFSATDKQVISAVLFGSDSSSTNGTFSITWTNGIITFGTP